MEEHTCAIDGCGRGVFTIKSGWCKNHYRWAKKNQGDPLRYCEGCKNPLPVQGGRQRYCGSGCRPRCTIVGCGRASWGSFEWCRVHYERDRNTGSPLTPPKRAKAKRRHECLACSAPIVSSRYREYCSNSCWAFAYRQQGDFTKSAPCANPSCGNEIDYTSKIEGRRKKRADALLCGECMNCGRIWKKKIPLLIERDGLDCGICGDEIDPEFTWPHREALTVDHIEPRSRGGGHQLSNLRLAHFACNRRRSNLPDEGAMRGHIRG